MALVFNTPTVTVTFARGQSPNPLPTPPASRPASPDNNNNNNNISNVAGYVLQSITPPPSRPASPDGHDDDPMTGVTSPGELDEESGEEEESSEEESDESDEEDVENEQEPATTGTSSTAPVASQVKTPTTRARRRPRGGSVFTPVRNITTAGKGSRCRCCLKSVAVKFKADHNKTHLMDHSGVARVPDNRRCRRCLAKGRPCIVNIRPADRERNTLRCYCCIKYKETCSLLSSYRNVSARNAEIHPALV